MNFEGFQWVVGVLILPIIWLIYNTMRSITNDLWNALHEHEKADNQFHIDIVQNVIPNSMRDLAARMDARFDRLEDKIEKERTKK